MQQQRASTEGWEGQVALRAQLVSWPTGPLPSDVAKGHVLGWGQRHSDQSEDSTCWEGPGAESRPSGTTGQVQFCPTQGNAWPLHEWGTRKGPIWSEWLGNF